MGKIKLILLFLFFLSTPLFAQDKVDLVALRNGINSGTVTVTTSATAIPTTALAGRRVIIIVNISSGNIFLGNSSVTTANGYQLYTQQAISMDVSDAVTVYGIVAAGTGEVRYLEAR
jgi:hypothetical protein